MSVVCLAFAWSCGKDYYEKNAHKHFSRMRGLMANSYSVIPRKRGLMANSCGVIPRKRGLMGKSRFVSGVSAGLW